jgi:hypothetical protein
MRAAVVSLVILAGALVSSAQAGTADLWYNANCPGTADSKDKFSSGKCFAGEGTSVSVTCSGASWTMSIWTSSTTCSGP